MPGPSGKLRLHALIALVVGSMLGSGIFSLPQNVAANAGAGAVMIGWAITAVGMLCLALTFQMLANRQPGLEGGIYAYAKAGFGDYIGFSSAWGYWISAVLGNVGYLVLLFSTLGYFFPVFGEGNTWPAIAAASALLWLMHFLVLLGNREAVFLNQMVTIAKVVPLLLFILVALFAFRMDVFTADIWGSGNPSLGSVSQQVRNMMLVTVWVFIGIEGAGIFSGRAENRADIGKATVTGFLVVLSLLVLVSMLSMGIMHQPELAKLQNPSMAAVLIHVTGYWGGFLISAGLVIALLGSLLSWLLLSAEILSVAARDGTMPAFLHLQNARYAPANALWLTNGMVQVFLLVMMHSKNTYLSLIYLATSMILVPYLWSAAYALLLAIRGNRQANSTHGYKRNMLLAGIALVYAIWLMYSGGIKYILLSSLLYAPGIILFARAKQEAGQPILNFPEKLVFTATFIGALIAAYGLYAGLLTL